MQGHLDQVWPLAFSPDGQTLASGSKDGTAKLWTSAFKRGESRLRDARVPLQFSSDGTGLLAANADATLSWWDVRSRLKDRRINLGLKMNEVSVDVNGHNVLASSPESKTLAAGRTNGTVELWDLKTGRLTTTKSLGDGAVTWLRFSPSNKLLGAICANMLTIWDVVTGQHWVPIDQGASELAFSPDDKILAVDASDAAIRLWDLANSRELLALKGRTFAMKPLVFSLDAKLLAAGGVDNAVRLWDTSSGKPRVLRGHMAGVSSAAFLADGKTLVSRSTDIRLWDLEKEQELLSLKPALSIGFGKLLMSADGSAMAVETQPDSGYAGDILLLRAPPFEEIAARDKAKAAARVPIPIEN